MADNVFAVGAFLCHANGHASSSVIPSLTLLCHCMDAYRHLHAAHASAGLSAQQAQHRRMQRRGIALQQS